MPVLLVPTALPIGEITRHSAVKIFLRFGNANALIRQIEMCLYKVICITEAIGVYTAGKSRAITEFVHYNIVVRRYTMLRNCLQPVKAVLHFQ